MTSVDSAKKRASYRAASAADPFVFTKKTSFMQRLGDSVRSGARHYVGGQITLHKLPTLAQKFSERYPVNLSRVQEHRTRQAGHDAARLLCWLDDASNTVHWVLFYFPCGKNLCTLERWKNPFDDRIQLTNYELVRVTKPGAKVPVITWRYSREQYRILHDQIVFSIRGRQDAVLDQLIFSLSRSPGFSGVREQVKGLWKIVRAEWKRTRSRVEEPPKIPPNIGYVRRLPDAGMTWSQLSQPKKGAKDGHTPETQGRKARKHSILVQPGAGCTPEKA